MKTDTVTGYVPAEDELYMNEKQLEHFRRKLVSEKFELKRKIAASMKLIQELKASDADIVDRSNSHINIDMEINAFQRNCDLIRQTEKAIARIEDGSFGYCEITGLAIGLRRLEVHPCATMSIEAREMYEASRKNPIPAGRNFMPLWEYAC